MRTCYSIIALEPYMEFRPRSIRKARRIIRCLVEQNRHVICDRIKNEHNKCSCERLFRNQWKPLNRIKA